MAAAANCSEDTTSQRPGPNHDEHLPLVAPSAVATNCTAAATTLSPPRPNHDEHLPPAAPTAAVYDSTGTATT